MKIIAIILFLLSISLFAEENPMQRIFKKNIQYKIDSMFNEIEAANYATVFKREPKIYCGAAYRTINVDFDEVRNAFQDFNWITNLLGIITKFERIEDGPAVCSLGTYDFEAKVSLARGWCILNVDSINTDTVGLLKIVLKGNADSTLNAEKEEGHNGFWTVKCDNYYMKWRIQRRDGNRTRLGFVIWMTPRSYIPYWLYKIVSKSTLPGLLIDLEKQFLSLNK